MYNPSITTRLPSKREKNRQKNKNTPAVSYGDHETKNDHGLGTVFIRLTNADDGNTRRSVSKKKVEKNVVHLLLFCPSHFFPPPFFNLPPTTNDSQADPGGPRQTFLRPPYCGTFSLRFLARFRLPRLFLPSSNRADLCLPTLRRSRQLVRQKQICLPTLLIGALGSRFIKNNTLGALGS